MGLLLKFASLVHECLPPPAQLSEESKAVVREIIQSLEDDVAFASRIAFPKKHD